MLSTLEARPLEHLYAKVRHAIPAIEWPAFAARHRRDQGAEARAQRRHPGAQLHDAGDLPLRRRFRRRQPRPGARGGATRCRRHRPGRRAFHGRDLEDPLPDKTVLIPDRGAGCSLAASITAADVRLLKQKLSRPAGRHLCEHLGRGEGRKRHLLHLAAMRKVVVESLGVRPHVIMLPGRISGAATSPRRPTSRSSPGRAVAKCMSASPPQNSATARATSRRHRAGPSGMPARSGGGSRFRRLDRGDDRLCRRPTTAAGGAGHRMLDERQCRRRHPDLEFVRPCNLCPHMKRSRSATSCIRSRP